MSHLSGDELKTIIDAAKSKVSVGSKYYHYKDSTKLYTIINIALLESTQEPAVIYSPDYAGFEGVLWIRALSEFLMTQEVGGKIVNKFTKVE